MTIKYSDSKVFMTPVYSNKNQFAFHLQKLALKETILSHISNFFIKILSNLHNEQFGNIFSSQQNEKHPKYFISIHK